MGCVKSKEERPTAEGNNTKTDAPPKAVVAEKQNTDTNVSQMPTLESVYKVGEEIGRGAFSVVKKASNKKTGEEVAIKIIDKKLVDKQDLVLLSREIDIMKKVDHSNVLKLKGVYEKEDEIALAMELVVGGELFYKIVDKGNYSEKDAALIVAQIVDGVEYLHNQGIAHRDLKPENLLCAEDDPNGKFKPFRVVIADFGLSKVFNEEETLNTSCGTPDYVAPEVITAENSYDKSVDMWSCGVITYVLLCGFSPFLSSTQTGLFEKIIRAEFDFPDPEWTNISEEAKDFIRHLLVKDPQERFNATQCKSHPWLSATYGSDVALAGGKISENMRTYNDKRKEGAQ
eukprot:TRINITY_DN1552_c0_g2_i1.p1 TRINITY_DN1552_c0_g2~~TRINITY_DN1552_c0_g2_i1.p1  ORF type:complete len:343 (-),score=101.91 TRINITY_DN1552_c0_g2_i1:243-1271(-)